MTHTHTHTPHTAVHVEQASLIKKFLPQKMYVRILLMTYFVHKDEVWSPRNKFPYDKNHESESKFQVNLKLLGYFPT